VLEKKLTEITALFAALAAALALIAVMLSLWWYQRVV
jgi:Ca-activated chloride channel family protein